MIETIRRDHSKEGRRAARLTKASRIYQQASRALWQDTSLMPSDERYNITLCHEKKFIWFRVAKAATRTIFDVLDQAGVVLEADHALQCHYPVKLYQDYFKFAFVRNPWDRLVSCWYNKVYNNNRFGLSPQDHLHLKQFENFVDYIARQNLDTCNIHYRRQTKLIDLNHLDYLGRLENFESDLGEIIQILQLGDVGINKRNVSRSKKHYRTYYTDDTRRKVAYLYRKEIQLFSYTF